jgi:hypothetical protein
VELTQYHFSMAEFHISGVDFHVQLLDSWMLQQILLFGKAKMLQILDRKNNLCPIVTSYVTVSRGDGESYNMDCYSASPPSKQVAWTTNAYGIRQ